MLWKTMVGRGAGRRPQKWPRQWLVLQCSTNGWEEEASSVSASRTVTKVVASCDSNARAREAENSSRRISSMSGDA